MSFAFDLWDKFEFLSKNGFDNKAKLEQFANLVRQRTELEDYYAKCLEKIGSDLTSFIEKGTVSLAFAGLKSDHMHHYEQTKYLANSLKTDVLDYIKELMTTQENEIRNFGTDFKKYERDLRIAYENLEKSKAKYIKACKHAEDAFLLFEILRNTKDCHSDKLKFQESKVVSLDKVSNELSENYKKSINEYNETLDIFKKNLCFMLDTQQRHEKDRINLIKDSIMKILIFEISVVRNLQYDVDKICKKIELVDPEADLLEFIKENKTNRPMIEKAKFEPYISFLNRNMDQAIETKQPENIVENFEHFLDDFQKYYENLIDDSQNKPQIDLVFKLKFKRLKNKSGPYSLDVIEKAKNIASIIKESWEGVELNSDKLKEFVSLTKDKLGRTLWCMAFSQYRLSQYNVLYEMGYENLVKLVNQILSTCLIEKDISTAKKTMILIFSYHKMIFKFVHGNAQKTTETQIKEEKVFLQDGVVNHPLWKTLDFWDFAVFESIREELRNQDKYKYMEKNQEKNIIFGQLAAFSHNMLMFNIARSTVKEIIGKFAQNHGLEEEKIQSIYNLINEYEAQGLDASKKEKMKNNSFSHLYKDLDFRKKENFGLIYDMKPKNEEEEKKPNISHSSTTHENKVKSKRGRRIFDNDDQKNITKSDVFE